MTAQESAQKTLPKIREVVESTLFYGFFFHLPFLFFGLIWVTNTYDQTKPILLELLLDAWKIAYFFITFPLINLGSILYNTLAGKYPLSVLHVVVSLIWFFNTYSFPFLFMATSKLERSWRVPIRIGLALAFPLLTLTVPFYIIRIIFYFFPHLKKFDSSYYNSPVATGEKAPKILPKILGMVESTLFYGFFLHLPFLFLSPILLLMTHHQTKFILLGLLSASLKFAYFLISPFINFGLLLYNTLTGKEPLSVPYAIFSLIWFLSVCLFLFLFVAASKLARSWRIPIRIGLILLYPPTVIVELFLTK